VSLAPVENHCRLFPRILFCSSIEILGSCYTLNWKWGFKTLT
jgi:hypothetical protein